MSQDCIINLYLFLVFPEISGNSKKFHQTNSHFTTGKWQFDSEENINQQNISTF